MLLEMKIKTMGKHFSSCHHIVHTTVLCAWIVTTIALFRSFI